MDDLKELLEDELKKIARQENMTPQTLEGAYKAIDILKDIETIKAMREAYPEEGKYSMDGNMSRNMSRNSYNYANDGRSYGPIWNQDMMPEHSMRSYNSYDGRAGRDADNDGRYSEEGSYARGRDARGRFTSRDGSYNNHDNSREYSREYSRHTQKDLMINKLETMADTTADPTVKRAIEQCINKLEG